MTPEEARKMTLDEAIEWSRTAALDMDIQNMPRFAQAVRLGIEALKRIQQLRRFGASAIWEVLPGETEK